MGNKELTDAYMTMHEQMNNRHSINVIEGHIRDLEKEAVIRSQLHAADREEWRERVHQLETIVQELTEEETAGIAFDGNASVCVYCSYLGEAEDVITDFSSIVHAPNCPIVRGREMVKEKKA